MGKRCKEVRGPHQIVVSRGRQPHTKTDKSVHRVANIDFPYEVLLAAAQSAELEGLVEALERIPVHARAQQYGTLTNAELEVLKALAEDKSLAETALSLFISVNTVKTHCRAIYSKLGAPSRAEALATARILGLL